MSQSEAGKFETSRPFNSRELLLCGIWCISKNKEKIRLNRNQKCSQLKSRRSVVTNRLSSTIGDNERNGPMIHDVASVKYNRKIKWSHIS